MAVYVDPRTNNKLEHNMGLCGGAYMSMAGPGCDLCRRDIVLGAVLLKAFRTREVFDGIKVDEDILHLVAGSVIREIVLEHGTTTFITFEEWMSAVDKELDDSGWILHPFTHPDHWRGQYDDGMTPMDFAGLYRTGSIESKLRRCAMGCEGCL